MNTSLHSTAEAKNFTIFMLIADVIFVSLLFATHMN